MNHENHDNAIYLDRDPVIYKIIINYLRNDKIISKVYS